LPQVVANNIDNRRRSFSGSSLTRVCVAKTHSQPTSAICNFWSARESVVTGNVSVMGFRLIALRRAVLRGVVVAFGGNSGWQWIEKALSGE